MSYANEGIDLSSEDYQGKNHASIAMSRGNKAEEGDDELPENSDVIYGVDDTPPWYMCIFLGLQHYLTMFGSTVSIPFILCPALCIEEDDPARGYLISTLMFISGLVTLIQSTFGIRLPIVQGGTFAFLVPTFAILSLERNACPADFSTNGWGPDFTYEQKTEEWQRRMREVQGAVIVASFFQVFMGYFGLIGYVLKYITPLTIAPSVCMVGLALYPAASGLSSKNWPIAMLTVATLILFSQYLRNISIPGINVGREKGFPIFKLFPVLLTIIFVWILCAILTAADAFGESNAARTDIRFSTLDRASWIRIPYPFQWGWPIVSIAGVLGMFAGVLSSAIESIGDYYACARMAGAPPPPTHAINRGIGTEGIGCIIAGVFGTGNGTTSYSENVGAIGVTKVGSRRVIQYGGVIMLIFGLFSKFGAFFVTIPEPIVGGIFCVMFSMIAAVGLSNVQFINLNSSRNLFILGFSIFFGLMLPQWLQSQSDISITSVVILDQIILVLLKTSMFVSGALGFILDNTIPGSPEERGLTKWNEQLKSSSSTREDGSSPYDLPYIMPLLRRLKFTKYIPFLPTFDESALAGKCCRRKRTASQSA